MSLFLYTVLYLVGLFGVLYGARTVTWAELSWKRNIVTETLIGTSFRPISTKRSCPEINQTLRHQNLFIVFWLLFFFFFDDNLLIFSGCLSFSMPVFYGVIFCSWFAVLTFYHWQVLHLTECLRAYIQLDRTVCNIDRLLSILLSSVRTRLGKTLQEDSWSDTIIFHN